MKLFLESKEFQEFFTPKILEWYIINKTKLCILGYFHTMCVKTEDPKRTKEFLLLSSISGKVLSRPSSFCPNIIMTPSLRVYDSLALQMVAKNETQDKKLQEFSIVLIAALSENVIYKN